MKPSRTHPSPGFSLVEVALALGIASFALLALFGLFPVGISSNQASIEQTNATNIATAIIADLHQAPTAAALAANPSLTPKSPRYGIDVTQNYFAPPSQPPPYTFYLDETGTPVSSAANARYQAALILKQPASGQRTAACGSLTISWPAAAATPLGAVTNFMALDRN